MKKKHIGSDFDDFLREEHLLEASEAAAAKRVGAGSAPPLREILIAKPLSSAREPSGKHPVDRVFGRLRLEKPVDTLLDEMRGRSFTRTVSPPDRLGDLFLEIFGPTRGEDVEIPPREPHDPMDLE